MKTPPQLVHEAHGSPRVEGCVEAEGRCYLCGGESTRWMPVDKWMGSGFSDHQRATCPMSGLVCEACVSVSSRVAPVLGRPAGACSVCKGTMKVVTVPKAGKGSKSRKGDDCPKCDGTGMNPGGGNARNVSHLYEAGWAGAQFGPDSKRVACYSNASKGEKPLIRDFLRREHAGAWFAAIADTGQLHILPFTPLNGEHGRAGVVAFERLLVVVPPDTSLMDDATALLTAGATKDEIATGNYGPNAWRLCEDAIRRFEEQYRRQRNGDWFTLAIWLAQRDEDVVQRRQAAEKEERDAKRKRKPAAPKPKQERARKDHPSRDRDVAARSEPSVHAHGRPQGVDTLEAPAVVARSEPDGRGNDRSVAAEAKQKPANHDAEQLTLFGVRGP